MATKLDTGWAKYSPGSFQKCGIKGHHGCLDQFEADGNIQFIRDIRDNKKLGKVQGMNYGHNKKLNTLIACFYLVLFLLSIIFY